MLPIYSWLSHCVPVTQVALETEWKEVCGAKSLECLCWVLEPQVSPEGGAYVRATQATSLGCTLRGRGWNLHSCHHTASSNHGVSHPLHLENEAWRDKSRLGTRGPSGSGAVAGLMIYPELPTLTVTLTMCPGHSPNT